MLLLAIYTRQSPFNGMLHAYVIYQVGLGKLQPDIPESVPQELKKVMRKCWDVDPTKRPSTESILETLEPKGKFHTNVHEGKFHIRRYLFGDIWFSKYSKLSVVTLYLCTPLLIHVHMALCWSF